MTESGGVVTVTSKLAASGELQAGTDVNAATYVSAGTLVYVGAGNGKIVLNASDVSITFDEVTNGAATGVINPYGYAGGTTQARSLIVYDGKGVASGNQILKLDGTNDNVTISNGSLSVKTTGLIQGALSIGVSTKIAKIDTATTGVAVNHGSLSADASNSVGRITGIGAFGSITLVFGSTGGTSFSTIAHCFVQVISGTYTSEGYQVKVTPSASAPIFACYTSSIAGNGSTANCPDLEYWCVGN